MIRREVSGLRVRAVIVTHNNARDVGACLRSIQTSRAELQVVVVDNASTDGTLSEIDASGTAAAKLALSTNCGFAAAVNLGCGSPQGLDAILLVNPDVTLRPDTLDALLALRDEYPEAGLYGGRMLDPEGRLDPKSCIAAPSLWSYTAFATGFSTLRGAPLLDPDSLWGWRRTGTRRVPILSAGVLLIDADLWSKVGGFDPRFFMYGEDVDLCLRARELGASPMFTDEAVYTHVGGASSANNADRLVMICAGKATLAERRLPVRAGRLAQMLLMGGVVLRAAMERVARPGQYDWREVWRRREEWRRGWPPLNLAG